MPSLYLLSRTQAYAPVRLGLAGLAVVAALGWMADRAGLAAGPIEGIATALVEHPFTVAASFALFAGLTSALPQARRPAPGPAASRPAR